MVFVKVCGVRDLETALAVCEAGADAVGFVFHRRSPRFVELEVAGKIALSIPPQVVRVAVIKSADEFVPKMLEFCHLVQVYEPLDIDPSRLILGVSGFTSAEAAYYLLDSSHGTGRFAAYPEDLFGLPRERVIVSGGLNPENVASVIAKYRPFGVDVSSGVERAPGVKDLELVKRFIERVREAERCL